LSIAEILEKKSYFYENCLISNLTELRLETF
jgi:hypothetical protein